MNKRHNKARETQRQQAQSSPKVSPRWLARSVAKYYGGGQIDEAWRIRVARLPRTGRSRIHHKIVRVEE